MLALSLSIAGVTTAFAARARARSKPIHEARADTISNLHTAIAGEANAAHRYRLFAIKADEEGDHQVAELFIAAAESESVHRRNQEEALLSLGGQPVAIELEAVKVGSTRQNLELPLVAEKREQSETYPRFVAEAHRAGADVAERAFADALASEKQHEALFRQALDRLGKNPPQAFYVSNMTGKTYAKSPTATPPSADRAGERYLRIG
jgi:rubrerythrin